MTRPVVAVGGIATDGDGRVLLVRRGQPPAEGAWTVPGGRVELGETLTEACVRELAEETGLEVAPGEIVEVLDRIGRDDAGGVTYHYVIVDFLVDVRGGALRPGSDVTDARWLHLHELAALTLTDGLVPVLQRALDIGRGPR